MDKLTELCFRKMDEAQVKPEEVGLPEPIGIQYYRRIIKELEAELAREKERANGDKFVIINYWVDVDDGTPTIGAVEGHCSSGAQVRDTH